MKPLAFVLLLCSCASAQRVDLGQYGGVLNDVYSKIGAHEVLFCLDAKQTRTGWKVTGVRLPLQKGDSVSVRGEGCTDSQGDAHNHWDHLGGDFMDREIGWFSDVDNESFKSRKNLKFSVLWFAPGKFLARVK